MTKEEFLKLTGIRQMSDPDYKKVEHAYMSVPDMDKQTFCELYANNQPELLVSVSAMLVSMRQKKSLKFLFLSDIFLFPPIRQQVPILA